MQRTEIHRPTVTPCLAPGGIWMRLCTRTKLLKEGSLTMPTDCALQAEADAMKTRAALEQGETVWLYFYDGDTGACIGTCIHQC